MQMQLHCLIMSWTIVVKIKQSRIESFMIFGRGVGFKIKKKGKDKTLPFRKFILNFGLVDFHELFNRQFRAC